MAVPNSLIPSVCTYISEWRSEGKLHLSEIFMSMWVLLGMVEILIAASSSVQIANILEARLVGAVNTRRNLFINPRR